MTVHVLDDQYLAITALITIGYQLIAFAIAFSFKFDKITDFAGGTNFIWLAVITLAFSGHHNGRQIVASLFLMVWAARLAGFLLFRILKTGKDDRFDDKRDKFLPFFGFFVFQMVWCWICSLPVTVLNSPSVTRFYQPPFGQAEDIIGIIFFAVGFSMESISDIQKYRFKQAHPDKRAVCDAGLFSWSRHPNYFGEILIQFGIFLLCITPASHGYVSGGGYKALYTSILGPFFLTALLLFVSGLPLQERPGAKKRYEAGNNWEGYKTWLDRTSILWPLPPALWVRLPTVVKRTIGLEWPMYVFDSAKHADQSKVQQQATEEGRADAS